MPSTYYRGKYIIVFYEDDDETLVEVFDNIRAILRYKGNPRPSFQDVKTMQCDIQRALKKPDHRTSCLNGKQMRVYIVDMIEEE